MAFSSNSYSSSITIYPNSINSSGKKSIFMAQIGRDDFLIADRDCGFFGEEISYKENILVKAELNHKNACILRNIFPFTAPTPVLHNNCTFGFGDRLGNATVGHIRALVKYKNVIPVFAQQSVRELRLTNRTFEEVLDCVTFAVFKDGYKNGFGADGDHLKSVEEVQNAIDCGYSMITLDCRDYIRNEIFSMNDEQVNEIYIPDEELENIYLGKSINICDNFILNFEEIEFKRMSLIFNQAIEFARVIYKNYIDDSKNNLEFELSIDETLFPTTPNQHYFVANELLRHGFRISSLAPHFCGDFQKGIDYVGDINQFEHEFEFHAMIAKYFNYKISIHSGSDKFSIYPIIARLTEGNFHIKTSGTSWLEAMKCIAELDPELFREIHRYALSVFEKAEEYYHVTTNLINIPDIDNLSDDDLPNLLNDNDARQLIHITYGLILNLKDDKQNFVFRDKLYQIWNENEKKYNDNLEKHFDNHLRLIYRENDS